MQKNIKPEGFMPWPHFFVPAKLELHF